MAKPTVRIPDWASTGTNTDPGAGKEAAGWLSSERPPANWLNWLFNSIGQWLGYFEAKTDERKWVGHIDLKNASSQATWETGSVTVTDIIDIGNSIQVVFSGALTTSTSDIAILITPTTASDPGYTFRAVADTTSTVQISAHDDAGVVVNLGLAGVESVLYMAIYGP